MRVYFLLDMNNITGDPHEEDFNLFNDFFVRRL